MTPPVDTSDFSPTKAFRFIQRTAEDAFEAVEDGDEQHAKEQLTRIVDAADEQLEPDTIGVDY